MMRASLLLRLSPLLVLAAALVGFAAFLAHDGATRATAATMPSGFYVLKSDMSVGTSGTTKGYLRASYGGLHATDANYAADSFTFHGVEYQVTQLTLTNSKTLQLIFDQAIPAHMKSALTLWVDGISYSLASATQGNLGGTTGDSVAWTNTRRNWSGGDRVGVTISSSNIWSATLTAGDLLSGISAGCDDGTSQTCSSNLTDNTFTFGGADYQIVAFAESASVESLSLLLDKTIPESLDNLVLDVDSRSLVLAGGSNITQWTNTGINWSVGDTVQLRLTERQPPTRNVYFSPAHTIPVTEIGADGLRGSKEIEVHIDPPIPSGGSNVMVQILSNSTATRGADYGLSLPNAPGKTETKLLRLPEGASSASFTVFLRMDRLTEGFEAAHLRLVPIPDAPYRVFEDAANQRYHSVELSILDDSQPPPSSADAGRGIRIGPRSFTMTEGSSYTYTVRLNTAPSDDVVVTPFIRPYFSRGAPSISINPETLTFTSTNWSATQQFTVSAPQGDYSHANGTRYLITHGLSSDDGDYATGVDFNGPGIDGTMYTLVTVNDTQSSHEAPGQPTAVALTLGTGDGAVMEKTVSESAGEVAVTVTLDAPAPYGGITFRLVPSPDDTATRDTDYTMPASINIPAGERSGSGVIKVTDDGVDEADETVDIVAIATDSDLIARATLTITDPCDSCGSEGDTGVIQRPQTPQEKYADLIADMKEWRDDPCCAHNKAHTDRWDKALLAFGEPVSDSSLTPMTATEAQGYADRGWTRWERVAEALAELEAAPQSDPPNSAPTVSAGIGDITVVNESGTQQVSLSGVFSDADNDALTVTAASSNEAVATVSVAADYSTLTVSAKSRGTATITVTADDSNGGMVEDAFTVRVKAAPVVASALADVSMEEEENRDISLSGVFSDADGDSLTITVASSDAAVDALEFQGTLTLVAVSAGTSTVTVTAQDSDGNAVSDSFDVTVTAPQQPEQDPPPEQEQGEETSNGTLTVAAPLDDISLQGPQSREIALDGVFSGDGLTITAASSNYGVASVWVDGSTLTVVGTGTGTATITVTAEDADGNTVSDEFEVTVSPAS